jgi:hypothetical protein
VPAGQTLLGSNIPSLFTQTLTFVNPVNNVIYMINAADSTSSVVETFSFTVDSGILTCTQGGSSCLFTQTGNVFSANMFGSIDNSACITITSTIPYTSITVSGPGGNNGSFMALCLSSATTSISQISGLNSNISIYPNPASSIINVAGLPNANSTLVLTDMLGNTVKQIKVQGSQLTIDVSELNEGVYNISLSSHQGVVNKKVVIVR